MRHHKQRGQAISEFIVAMVWMVPVIIGFVAIAQMLNMQSTTHEAARYVAWERLAYDGATYQQRVAGGADGFSQEVTRRFFVNGGSGFGAEDGNYSRDWRDWQSNQSNFDIEQGVRLTAAADSDDVADDQQRLSGFLDRRSGESSWMSGRGGIELDTSVTAQLSVPVRADGNSAFAGEFAPGDPRLSTSYALISDSWAASSEDQFTGRVKDSRPQGLTKLRTWLQNNGGARLLRNQFGEIDEKLYSDPDSDANSFSTVSPEQSVALPVSLLEPYDE